MSQMIKQPIRSGILVAFACLFTSVASARTQPASAGAELNGTTCFRFTANQLGMINTCASSSFWEIPIPWDTAGGGNRTIIMRAHINPGAQVTCSYYALNPIVGALSANVPFPAFTPNTPGSSWRSSTITISGPNAGHFGHVICSASGNGQVLLLGADYFAP